jgi:hypothetical protein
VVLRSCASVMGGRAAEFKANKGCIKPHVSKKKKKKSGGSGHLFNPCTWEAEAGGSGLQSEFQDSQGYTEKPCLQNQNQNQNKVKLKGTRVCLREAGRSCVPQADLRLH